MIIVMKTTASAEDLDATLAYVRHLGLTPHVSQGAERNVIGLVGNTQAFQPEQFSYLGGVERVARISRPYKLASREFRPVDTTFRLDGSLVGGNGIWLAAGPCSVESREQIIETALAVKEAGAHALRGGAFKPRSSPYSFQGLGEKGLELLAEARAASGLAVITEVMTPEDLPLVARYADVLQIGARNMQNYALLRAVGKLSLPVLLKRGLSATIEELLMSAEYILSQGNKQVMLCERGIRTFETATRNTTDINAIPVLKSLTHLPVILDPSHGTGNWEYVPSVARAAIAAGADGLIVEVHPRPQEALSDGGQSLRPERFAELVQQLTAIAAAIGRNLAAYKEDSTPGVAAL
jgi:3-deoxy-7-phosphoheptulonate synthase